MMNHNFRRILSAAVLALVLVLFVGAAFAEETAGADATSMKAIAAAVTIGLASVAGAISMGMAISKASEGISRQPEAAGEIRSSMMLGLVFIETAIIYALIVAILIVAFTHYMLFKPYKESNELRTK